MIELALHCRSSGETVDLVVVYAEYTSPAALPHLLAYVGGSLDASRWRSERILIERTPDESVARVTEMGEWNAGSTYVRPAGSPDYRHADRRIVGPIDPDIDERIYECVREWVYWDENVLRIRRENVGPRYADGLAETGLVDINTVREPRSVWQISMPRSPEVQPLENAAWRGPAAPGWSASRSKSGSVRASSSGASTAAGGKRPMTTDLGE